MHLALAIPSLGSLLTTAATMWELAQISMEALRAAEQGEYWSEVITINDVRYRICVLPGRGYTVRRVL